MTVHSSFTQDSRAPRVDWIRRSQVLSKPSVQLCTVFQVIRDKFRKSFTLAIPGQNKSVVVIACELDKCLWRRRDLIQRPAHSKQNDLIVTAMNNDNGHSTLAT